ncbi:MAG: hypothetical protein IT483_13125 [Gammaproteobacteria bacterium]|nr:hypothetical protein [Gammaproteobacteria bacterium]
MDLRLILLLASGSAVIAPAGHAAGQAAPPQYEYRASWVAVASPEPVKAEIDSKSWARLVTFRPERAFILTAPLTEAGKSKPRLDAGTLMVGMTDGQGIACRLERPKFDYFVECVQDSNLDGQYDGLFFLNHENPFLFSARRQPRHQKVLPVSPVTLGDAPAEQVPNLDMVLLYSARSVISAASGSHTFQLCILRPGVKNIWGDKTEGRGCLPNIVVKDGEFPRRLQIYGRTLEIAAPVDGKASVSVSAFPQDLPVDL